MMHRSVFRRTGYALVFAVAAAVAAVGPVGPASPSATPVALASHEEDEEHVLRGQALAVFDPATRNWAVAPGMLFGMPTTPPGLPAIVVATHDGPVTALVFNPDEPRAAGLALGDHVRLNGATLETAFVAERIVVETKCCPTGEDED